jgi:hypothetical protein
MGTEVAVGPHLHSDEWTPARIFMLVSTIWHLPLGVAGLLYDQTFPIGPNAAESSGSEHIFGIFETNGWHSTAALLLGFISLYFLIRPARAREGALGIGVFHVGIVTALALWGPEVFWLKSNDADQIVHATTAITGILSAGLTPRQARPVSGVTAEASA